MKDTVPEAGYETPLDKAVVKKEGSDVTLIGISYLTLECLRAAELLAEQGVSAEVVDLRSVRPIDYETLIASVEKTGLVLIADHATLIGSIANDITAVLNESKFSRLKQAPIRIGLPDHPVPTSHELAVGFYPSAKIIANAMLSALNFPRLQPHSDNKEVQHDQPDTSFTGPF